MTPKQSEALETILGYLEAYECSLCGGSEPGQHTEGCPVLELRAMVNTPEKPQTLYNWSNAPVWATWADVEGSDENYTATAYWRGNEPPFKKRIADDDILDYKVPHLSYEKRPTNL